MTHRSYTLLFLLLLFFFLGACQSTEPPQISTRSISAVEVAPQFVVQDTKGMVQVRESAGQAWRFLKPGEKIKRSHSIRTGFNSSADVVMIDGERELKVELASLLPEFKVSDAYETVLCPEKLEKYIQERNGKRVGPARSDAVVICRDSLKPVESNDFLAVANINLELRSQQAGRSSAISGAGAGASGAASGGSGSSGSGSGTGGGC